MKKIGILLMIIIIAVIIGGVVLWNINNFTSNNVGTNGENNTNNSENEKESEKKEKGYSEDVEVLATLDDAITNNSVWCGTFQLVWNDMQNEVVGQDIVFQKQIELVENLNKQTFKEDDLSDEYYYKNWGLMTLDLKEEIEKGIKDKFDEPSDILDKLDWSNAPQSDSGYNVYSKDYLFYVMLSHQKLILK